MTKSFKHAVGGSIPSSGSALPSGGPKLRNAWSTALLLLSAFVHLPALLTSRPIDDDETYLTVMGRMLANGDRLDRDVVDRKPPLAIWAYRWLIPDSWSLRWVHVAAIMLVAVNGWVIAQIALKLGANGTTALTAGALSIIGSALLGHADAHSANFEVWGLVPASLAVWCILRSPRSLGWAAVGGAAVGVATNCKQPYVFTLIAVVAFAAPRRRITVAFVACITMLGVTAAIASISGWSDYWRWVWLENGDYIKIGATTIALVALRQTAIFAALQWPLVAGAVARLQNWGALRRDAASNDLHSTTHATDHELLVWIVAAFIGVASGLRFFGHYYQQVVPPLAILGAFGIASWPRARQLIIAATTWAVVLFGLVIFPSLRGLEAAPSALASALRHSTRPTDRVLVWGRLPDASVRSHRITAGRFVHHAYLTGLWANADATTTAIMDQEPYRTRWREYLNDLRRDPPTLVVDATPIVDGWSQFRITETPLNTLLRDCYMRSAQIDGLTAFRLRQKDPPIACSGIR